MPLGEAAGIGPDSLVTPTGRPLSIGVSRRRCSAACSTASGARSTAADPSPAPSPWPVDRPAPDPLTRRRVTPAAGARRARARRAPHRRRGAAHRPLRRLGRRQVDADGADRAPDRGRRQRHRARRRARPRGGRVPRGVAGPGGPRALGRRLRDQRRAQPGAPQARPSSRRPSPSTSASRASACCSCSTRSRASRAPSARSAWPPASRPRARATRPASSRCCRACSSAPGNDARGSITALYTVLVAGGDMDEPIADEVRGILDGHVDPLARDRRRATSGRPSTCCRRCRAS